MGNKIDRSEYQKAYYESRKEELSRKRKEKYHSDPEYRASVIRRSVEYRKKLQNDRKTLVQLGVIPDARKFLRREFVVFKGKEVPAYGICHVADVVGRNRRTIKLWVDTGIIPDTGFKSKWGSMLFTEEMVDVIHQCVSTVDRVRVDSDMRDRIIEGWKGIGLDVSGIDNDK